MSETVTIRTVNWDTLVKEAEEEETEVLVYDFSSREFYEDKDSTTGIYE